MIKDFPTELNEADIIELYNNPVFLFVCNDRCEVFDDIIHPDEDHEFNQIEVSRIWKRDGNNYILIYEKEDVSELVEK